MVWLKKVISPTVGGGRDGRSKWNDGVGGIEV